MILGESQIQGQVRDAWETSKAQAGPVLHRLFQSALLVGARVRSETGLATGAASAPSAAVAVAARDRKSTRLNSSHGYISYAVFCLKKKKKHKKKIDTLPH